jgi:hypothetical protein
MMNDGLGIEAICSIREHKVIYRTTRLDNRRVPETLSSEGPPRIREYVWTGGLGERPHKKV